MMKAARATLLGVAAAVTIAVAASATPGLQVAFTANDLGFRGSSAQEYSRVTVESCNLATHVHTGLSWTVLNHNETSKIRGIWVNGGNYSDYTDMPPGLGQRFDNAGACPTTTTVTASATVTHTATVTVTTTAPAATSTTTSTTQAATATEVPFFPSGPVLALGATGALLGAGFLLRRRL